MGWNPFSLSPSHTPSHSRSSSRRRSTSRARSTAGSAYSTSSRHYSSTSRYKRSPRHSYLQHLYAKLRHFLREIMAYARRHPYKVFFAVIMPLVSGGLLVRLARQFGVTLPDMAGPRGGFNGAGYTGERGRALTGAASSGGYYGSQGYGPERAGAYSGGGYGGGGWDMQSVAGGIGTATATIGSLASLAKMVSQFV
ncbi:hypothetical protein P153DRAFT_102315 [Dothidotthia symphoricarpi CBS 119687]|uniref:Uncharacterized protein n=1 Tax=Dothidotthia symphoricarpi CBS 119687 TaxID=1392245 RepID=A0A6A6ASK8_9PLEO|nr:uncharacterized protein P153DRAFT_102315 [Dothidotthia symphoricarpi CBS 119687]KAF2133975.1 hypothetical protein P153DRAFT_102315 [Dothidotthia symphoricarpi CBS 119687]